MDHTQSFENFVSIKTGCVYIVFANWVGGKEIFYSGSHVEKFESQCLG